MQIQYSNRSICFPGLIYCDWTWLLFFGVQITWCKICFTLGRSNSDFSLKSLSLCLRSQMNVPWSVDYKFIVWFKLWIYWASLLALAKSIYYSECYATMPMLADAHISSLGYLCYDCLIKLKQPVAEIHAKHSSEQSKKISAEEMFNLQPRLLILRRVSA